ncbi:MAG: CopG family transcriptional regulator [Gammaproteobacteria bacterium]|nr:CopG family transcriptional regulator [Gammaproteobacteria bacterium]
MSKASQHQKTQHLNAAVQIRGKYPTLSQAASALAEQEGISRRQAYRYLREAGSLAGPLPLPAPKITFTVKLPTDLISILRQYAKTSGRSLSELVTQAIRAFLERRPHG